ncbi:MAG: zinc ribbon domain-containing protein [Firmicutes bacterium]|nr:zinc ribbon domain-containing protein [Bacillota bacterium]
MPTYQFVCDSCGKDFEFFLMRMIRDTDKQCPSCGSEDVRQVYRDFYGYTLGRSSGGSSGGYSGGYSGGSSCTSTG